MSLPGRLFEKSPSKSAIPGDSIDQAGGTAQAWACQAATAAINSANPTILRTRLRL